MSRRKLYIKDIGKITKILQKYKFNIDGSIGIKVFIA